MNDLELEREIRATFGRRGVDVLDPELVPPVRRVVRRTRHRQLATVLSAVAIGAAVAIASVAGAVALLRASEEKVPATPPAPIRFGPLETVSTIGGPDGVRWLPIAAAGSDELWVGAGGPDEGAWRLADGTWTHFAGSEALASGFLDSFAFTPDGAVWASGYGGVARFDGSAWVSVAPGEHRALTLAPEGTPWAATWVAEDDGMHYAVGPVGGTPVPGSPVWVTDLEVIAGDDVWAGSTGYFGDHGGLSHFDGSTWVKAEPIAGASDLKVQDMARTPDDLLWVDLWFRPQPRRWSHVLARFDGETWATFDQIGDVSLERSTDLTPLWIARPLEVTPDGDLLFANSGGLLRLHEGTWTRLATGRFDQISAAQDGTLWLTGRGGLFRLPVL